MRKRIQSLRAKMGDFWWYSLLIFLACRSGDAIQAFIGLWLVPQYVGQEELGAVLPLQQLCALFAAPLAALATVFAKYVNTYATRGEYGKVKAFIRDTLWLAGGFFAVCIVAAYVILPHFYERLNIAAGLLTVLILLSGFIGNIAQLFTNALQGLKKFNTLTLTNLVSAPIRLVTLLVAMPFRPLSGYVLGQATPPATTSLIAAHSLYKDLKAIPRDTSWRKDFGELIRYFLPMFIYTGFMYLFGAISATVYRQRLPEVESAAYYLLSRFAEIAGYIGLSMLVVLFPLVAEAHEKGKEDTTPLKKTIWGISVGTLALALLFTFTARPLLNLTATWRVYLPYAQLLPAMTIIMGMSSVISTFLLYEVACKRFRISAFIVVVNALWATFLVCFTGYEFFRGKLPNAIVDSMGALNLATLTHLTYAWLACNSLQILGIWLFCRPFPRKRQR